MCGSDPQLQRLPMTVAPTQPPGQAAKVFPHNEKREHMRDHAACRAAGVAGCVHPGTWGLSVLRDLQLSGSPRSLQKVETHVCSSCYQGQVTGPATQHTGAAASGGTQAC